MSSKILGNILIKRIKNSKIEGIVKALRKEQTGFRKGRGTNDKIFILRNIIEQCVVWQVPLYINFIDFEKAISSIYRETHYGVIWSTIKVNNHNTEAV